MKRPRPALAKLSSNAEAFGVKTTSITKGPFGLGCVLKMSGKAGAYEVRVDGTGVLLGKVEKDGRRVKLHGAGTHTEACWAGVLAVLERSEGRPS